MPPKDAHHPHAESAAQIFRIAQVMAKIGMMPLALNFELIRQALSGHHPGLSREIAGLGAMPAQSALERIAAAHGIGGPPATPRDDLLKALAGSRDRVRDVRDEQADFARLLERFARALDEGAVTGLADAVEELKDRTLRLAAGTETLDGELDRIAALVAECADPDGAAGNVLTEDAVTGLPTRRALLSLLDATYANPEAEAKTALSLAAFPASPPVEDAVLHRMALALRTVVKKDDVVARVGANTFAFVFRDVTPTAAVSITHRLRRRIAPLLGLKAGAPETEGLVVAGFAMLGDAPDAATLIRRAEQALEAARIGRDGPVVAYCPDRMSGAEATYRRLAGG
ncbi:diguanylate cyclase domain-containing protein [Ensifer soli]|uniref:diguanylate cyclase domain-containing protein n=1 Tax=Ciceribacter sp. sgz301302 TaxID=3342379 RepID=UPI0035BA6F3B